jgi:hypothetical protein
MSIYYILKDKKPVQVERMQWVDSFDEDRHVRLSKFGKTLVSTVFLGLDHNYEDNGEPILFETMIFGGKHDQYQTRCSTWDEAIIQHEEACKLVSNKFVLWIRKILNI